MSIDNNNHPPAATLDDQLLTSSEVEQSDIFIARARTIQDEQVALIEASSLERDYNAALTAQIEAKHDQAEDIEDRLEHAIEQQSSRLQQTQTHPPGFFSMPASRSIWLEQIQQQQIAILRLQTRLDQVREIKDGMGLHSPRIQALAERKLRSKEPELVEDWEEMQSANRQHQAMLRKQEQEKRLAFSRELGVSLGAGLSLFQSLSR